MVSPSVPTCRGRVPWQGLLLAVLLLTFWSPPASAQLSIISANAAEGEDVLLRIYNTPPEVLGFMWFRGGQALFYRYIAFYSTTLKEIGRGPEFTGRETINDKGSMVIRNATMRDTGTYTVLAFLSDSKKEVGFGRLNVYQPVRLPTLIARNTTLTENKDIAFLTCYSNGLSTHWLFNDECLQLNNRMRLAWGNRTLIIKPVKREDAGTYHCEVTNPISSAESVSIELHVKYE
ncbi:cell adhesion molecule CEACAM21-like isoform 3-T3 [Molossus nigricans]|uniref:Ig-like domain-containing protein n=1 Tax=Molossus molossus TaxID=27622 RepID=A0A7J8C6A9_MOLMO|nr:hypothetical protein HJG59_002631 [Molossus molossus]